MGSQLTGGQHFVGALLKHIAYHSLFKLKHYLLIKWKGPCSLYMLKPVGGGVLTQSEGGVSLGGSDCLTMK